MPQEIHGFVLKYDHDTYYCGMIIIIQQSMDITWILLWNYEIEVGNLWDSGFHDASGDLLMIDIFWENMGDILRLSTSPPISVYPMGPWLRHCLHGGGGLVSSHAGSSRWPH